MKRKQSRFRDDRGAVCKIATDSDFHELKLKSQDFGIPKVGYKTSGMGFGRNELHWTFVFFVLGFILIRFSGAILLPRIGITFQHADAFLIVLAMWTVYPLHRYFWHRSYCTKIRECVLAHCMCPSCLYTLKDIRVQDDRCTVCPECGAAWRLPPQNETEPRAQAQGSGEGH